MYNTLYIELEIGHAYLFPFSAISAIGQVTGSQSQETGIMDT